MLKDIYYDLKNGSMPLKKRLKKLGTFEIGTVESTPIVWNDRLLIFQAFRGKRHEMMDMRDHTVSEYRFLDIETGEETPHFAPGHIFGCCYAENGKMYVHGCREGGRFLDTFVSDDLVHWEESTALEFADDIKVFNTSVCKGPDGYIMAIEIGGQNPIVGMPFTIVFAKSDDLIHWEMLPMEDHIYAQDRYTACPVIRYYDGYYYMIYLELMEHCFRLIPFIVRSKDLSEFEMAVDNPIMFYSDEDKQIVHPERFTKEQIAFIQNAVDINNSDIDLCNWQGKTIITYSWGNQLCSEFLALAEYEGTEQEFLESFF
ncbi:MAG: hypothetical protein IJ325_06365 [Clostridia bacterium]|nr:hypothetical protein [Clostridia bacterium]